MKVSNSKERIRELMEYYGINQTELCKRTGIQKSALSNYLNGDREPRQDQISLIVDPFGVNPAWLMGYDVPMMMPLSSQESQDSDRITKALEFYNQYEHLSPKDQIAFQTLLKSLQSDE